MRLGPMLSTLFFSKSTWPVYKKKIFWSGGMDTTTVWELDHDVICIRTNNALNKFSLVPDHSKKVWEPMALHCTALVWARLVLGSS